MSHEITVKLTPGELVLAQARLCHVQGDVERVEHDWPLTAEHADVVWKCLFESSRASRNLIARLPLANRAMRMLAKASALEDEALMLRIDAAREVAYEAAQVSK